MNRRFLLVGVVLALGLLVASGFVVGQPAVRVIQDGKQPDAQPPLPQLPSPRTVLPPAPSPPAETAPPRTSSTPSGVVPAPTAVQIDDSATPKTVEPQPEANAPTANPTGRQEPAVSLEWVGPPTIKLGQPATFQIVIKNVSTWPVRQTTVQSRIPQGVTVKATDPKPTSEGELMSWDLGVLEAQQEKRIDIVMVPDAKGRCTCEATVTFSASSSVQLQVQEPKLLLKVSGPERVLLGDPAATTLTVTNPGDSTADHVRIKATLSEGLEHSRGKEVEFEVGNLGPNESRSVELVCATKTAGDQKCDAVATAEGGLTSRDAAAFPVLQPKLELSMSGPSLRYLERQGTYVLHLVNTGNAPASNVTITEQVPQGFKFVSASAGGRQDYTTRTVSWFLGDLPPNQNREVQLQVLAVNIGEFKHQAVARAARGIQTEAEAETRVEGLSALQFELLDLEDPVEVGANCRYEIRVTNTGSKTETNIQVSCTVPEKMDFASAQGAGNCHYHADGKEVVFDPLAKLAPRADAVFRVNCKAKAPGDLRFKARIKADSLDEPVNKEESTRVYADQAQKSK